MFFYKYALALLGLACVASATSAAPQNKKLDTAMLLRHAKKVTPRELQQYGYYNYNNNNGNNNNGYNGYYSVNNAYADNSQNQNYENANVNANGGSYGGSNMDGYGYQVNAYGQYYKYQITNKHSVQFNKCISVRTEPDADSSMFANYLMDYTKNGQIVTQQSYVFFNMCEGASYCGNDESTLFMVALETFVEALVGYLPYQRESYCSACEQAADYCTERRQNMYNYYQNQYGNQQQQYDQAQEDMDAQQEEQDGGNNNDRHLTGVRCSVCESYGCFDGQDGEQAQYNQNQASSIDLDTAATWIGNYAGCYQTGQELDGYPLYAGLMCNGKGNGAELALFLDDACTIYTSTMSFATAMQNDEYNNNNGDNNENNGDGGVVHWYDYLSAAAPVLTYPFLNPISCAYVEFYQNGNNQNQNQYNQNQENANGQVSYANNVNEFCQNLYTENARSVARCHAAYKHEQANSAANYYHVDENYAQYRNNYNNNQYNQDGEEEEAEQNYVPSWYKYDIAQEDMESTFTVCKIVSSGKYDHSTVYNKQGSGENFKYGSSVSNLNGANDDDVMRALRVVGILALVLGSLAFLCACMMSGEKDSPLKRLAAKQRAMFMRRSEKEFSLMSDDDKAQIRPSASAPVKSSISPKTEPAVLA